MVLGYFRKRAKLCCLLFTMASRTRDSMYKIGELFRRILDETTDGLPSVGFPDTDIVSRGCDMT